MVEKDDDDVAQALHVCAADYGRSAEAEHREILRAALSSNHQASSRATAAARLAEFRRRTTGRGSASTTELLQESRTGRTASHPDDPVA